MWMQPSANFSVDAYLERHLGPKHLPQAIVVPLTVVYIMILISGLVGNFCVCLVVVKKTSMQTSTNYYLFSLAVSDLFLLVCGLPNDLWLFWQQYPWMLGETLCRTRALISEMTNYASVLTIVAFTVERYVAICHPLLSQTTPSLSRVAVVIGVNWLVAALSAIPFAIYTSVHYIDYPLGSKNYIQESAFCMMPTNANDNPHFRTLLCLSSLAFFFMPMTLIVILYIKIGITLQKSALRPTECSSLKGEGKPSSRRVIIKMLVAVVIAFIICWAPFHAQRLLFVYAEARHWPIALRRINEILYFAGCLYYLNATINPVLYNLMSAKYREAFREILCEKWSSAARCCSRTTTSSKSSSRRHHSFSLTRLQDRNGHRQGHCGSCTIVDTSTLAETDVIIGPDNLCELELVVDCESNCAPINSQPVKHWYLFSSLKNKKSTTTGFTIKNNIRSSISTMPSNESEKCKSKFAIPTFSIQEDDNETAV